MSDVSFHSFGMKAQELLHGSVSMILLGFDIIAATKNSNLSGSNDQICWQQLKKTTHELRIYLQHNGTLFEVK